MGFEVPIGADFDPTDSVYVSSPGRYHLAIVDCDEDGMRIGGKNNKGEMVVEFEVLSGSTPNQEGLRHKSYFTKSPAAAWRIMRLALAGGLITADEVNKLKEQGKFPVLEFERDLKGRQIFGELAESEYNGKTTIKLEGGMYHLASKSCENKVRWPRNEAMILRSGVKMPAENKTAAAATSKPATTTKPATQMKQAESPSDDLLSGVV